MRGAQTGSDKRPAISVALANAGTEPTITMTVNGKTVDAVYADGRVTYTPAADLTDGRTEVVVTAKRTDGKEASFNWFFTVGKTQYQLYFGQLHSHTAEYSDGSGTLTCCAWTTWQEHARERQRAVRSLHRPLQLLRLHRRNANVEGCSV